MTRAALIVTVAFAAYGAISSVLALLVGVAWRAGYLTRKEADPASRANWLVALRITPSVLGFLLSVGVVLPVYLAFEPIRDHEPVGPIPIVLAAIGLLVVFAASCVAARAAFLTRRIRRAVAAVGDRARHLSGGGRAGVRRRYTVTDGGTRGRVFAAAGSRTHGDRCLQRGGTGRHRRARARPSACARQLQALAPDLHAGRDAVDQGA